MASTLESNLSKESQDWRILRVCGVIWSVPLQNLQNQSFDFRPSKTLDGLGATWQSFATIPELLIGHWAHSLASLGVLLYSFF